MNGILQARFQAEASDTQIDAALAPFTARHMPMLWWVGPATRSADLGARLPAHGLTHAEDMPGMAVDLAALTADRPATPDLMIQQVATTRLHCISASTSATCFEFAPELASAVCELFASVGFGVGLCCGEAVATWSLFLGTESAGIYCVATLPSARRQGIGMAITRAALQEARALGYRIAILQSSAMGHNSTATLGFAIAAPSASISGRVRPTTKQEVAAPPSVPPGAPMSSSGAPVSVRLRTSPVSGSVNDSLKVQVITGCPALWPWPLVTVPWKMTVPLRLTTYVNSKGTNTRVLSTAKAELNACSLATGAAEPAH